MRKEKVATLEMYEKGTKKHLYLCRTESWLYTLEDAQGNTIKVFEPEEAPIDSLVPVFTLKAEEYLEEFKNKLSQPCIILYEVERLKFNDLDKAIGFKPLKKWYEEFLSLLNSEIIKTMDEDFVKAFWQTFRTFYRNTKIFRKLLCKERYVLEQLFSSILVYVHMILTGEDSKAEKLLTNLYGEGFKNWLFETVKAYA